MAAPLPQRHRMVVHLIRHASSDWTASDPKMSDLGLEQCMNYDVSKKSINQIRQIISSPAFRALDTARELFKEVLLGTPTKVVMWAELQSYSNAIFQEAEALNRLRHYGMETVDVSRLVETGATVGARKSNRMENVKVVKEWLLKQRSQVSNEPFEIAVVSHSSILGHFVRDGWKGLTWVTCVYNDKDELERLPGEEFDQLKALMQEKRLAAARKIIEDQELREGRERQRLMLGKDPGLAADLGRLGKELMNIGKRLEPMFSNATQINEQKVQPETANTKNSESKDSSSVAINPDSLTVSKGPTAEEYKSRLIWNREMLLKHDQKLATERRSLERNQLALSKTAYEVEYYEILPTARPRVRPGQTRKEYFANWRKKIETGLTAKDEFYLEKSFEFPLFSSFERQRWDGIRRLILKQLWSKPEQKRPTWSDVCTFRTTLSIRDIEQGGRILDFSPFLNDEMMDQPTLEQIRDEIENPAQIFSAGKGPVIRSQSLLPILISVWFPEENSWYRGYIPGPKGMEKLLVLSKWPPATEPRPTNPIHLKDET